MLELFTTPEFAGWFEALGDAEAEAVATALEVLARRDRSSRPGPEHGSTMLLWMEDQPRGLASWHRELHAYLERSDEARTLLRRLETPRAAAQFARLPAADAQRALELMMAIQGHVGTTALRLRLGGTASIDPRSSMRRAYAELAALIHLEEEASTSAAALRELVVPHGPARLRVLFGLDFSRRHGLLVLGERLDRRYYGDSVRRALRVWEQFRTGDRDAVELAPALR